MEENDKIIEDLFDRIKKADEKLVIPAFPMKKNKSRLWFPISIAATVIILIGTYFLIKKGTKKSDSPEIHLIISVDRQETTDFLSTPASMEAWESPTNSLVADF